MVDTATVLVVDDEEAILELLDTVLGQIGHTVISAGTGEGALAVAKEQDFDLALVDINLPDMDGVELVRQLAEIRPDSVAAIMTGHGTLRSGLDAMGVGVARYLLKPFEDLAVVTRIVDDVLGERHERLRQRESLSDAELPDRGLEGDEDGAPIRVIVADASDDDRATMGNALRTVGCTVLNATCAQEALLVLEKGQQDVLVVAYDMGDMTADDVLLRAKRVSEDVAVVVTAAEPTLAMTTSLIRRGAAGFIEKPLKDVIRTADSIVRKGRAARQQAEVARAEAEADTIETSDFPAVDFGQDDSYLPDGLGDESCFDQVPPGVPDNVVVELTVASDLSAATAVAVEEEDGAEGCDEAGGSDEVESYDDGEGSAEPGDDEAVPDAEPGDDEAVTDAEPGDDEAVTDAEPGDDEAVTDAEPGDDEAVTRDDAGDDQDVPDDEASVADRADEAVADEVDEPPAAGHEETVDYGGVVEPDTSRKSS